MATHNNVEATAIASTGPEQKRVSFGGEEHVQMIVYDDGLTDDYTIGHQQRLQQEARHTFTEPDAPPSRVKVHAEQVEVPRPISPPAQIGRVPVDAANISTSPQQQSAATAAASTTATAAQQITAATTTTTSTMVVNTPPLPSFIKQAEHNVENPFRPDEPLYHEVAPIVEQYRQRPFPPSSTSGSPIPPHEQQTPTRQQPMNATTTTTPIRTMSPNRREIVVANGGGGGAARHSSLAEARREAAAANNQQQQQMSPTRTAEQQPLIVENSGATNIGPPGHAEVVRLPEKKKRACCSLQ